MNSHDKDDERNARKIIDGKEVRIFLFARFTKFIQQGAIPVDRKRRAEVLNASDQKRYLVQVQVEGFSVDHALDRLQNECVPFIPRADWELIEELDPTHDIGMMGEKFPLNPMGATRH